MTPEISEFSYGFALTHELANFSGQLLSAAPIFPSLIEEGKTGGGYDVRLDVPGLPVFLQFKRADCLIKRSAKQIKDGHILSTPFYRFPITRKSHSRQHDLLLDLDIDPNVVYYVAPRFYRVTELNAAYTNKLIVDRSCFIRPRDIGPLTDEPHVVVFDEDHHFICSDPRPISALDGVELQAHFEGRLTSEERALKDVLDETISRAEKALAHANIHPQELDFGRSDKTEGQRQLRQIADLTLRYFGAQFLVIQMSRHIDYV